MEDIHGFLDALKIAKVDLIGHSLAGEELTLFAGRYPERVEKLVYFDTLFDHSPEVWKEMQSDPVPRSSLIQKASMEAMGLPGAARIQVSQMPPPDEWAILVATLRGMINFQPDYRKVRAPALAFCAVTANPHYPRAWLPQDASAELHAQADAWWREQGHALIRRGLEKFQRELPQAKVIELDDAPHYIFRGSTRDEVIAKTRAFLLQP